MAQDVFVSESFDCNLTHRNHYHLWTGQTRLVFAFSKVTGTPLQKHSQLVFPASRSRRSISLNSSISARLALDPPPKINTALPSPFSAGIADCQRWSINPGSYKGVNVAAHASSVITLCSSDDPPTSRYMVTAEIRKWCCVTCERNGRTHHHLVWDTDTYHSADPHPGSIDDLWSW